MYIHLEKYIRSLKGLEIVLCIQFTLSSARIPVENRQEGVCTQLNVSIDETYCMYNYLEHIFDLDNILCLPSRGKCGLLLTAFCHPFKTFLSHL